MTLHGSNQAPEEKPDTTHQASVAKLAIYQQLKIYIFIIYLIMVFNTLLVPSYDDLHKNSIDQMQYVEVLVKFCITLFTYAVLIIPGMMIGIRSVLGMKIDVAAINNECFKVKHNLIAAILIIALALQLGNWFAFNAASEYGHQLIQQATEMQHYEGGSFRIDKMLSQAGLMPKAVLLMFMVGIYYFLLLPLIYTFINFLFIPLIIVKKIRLDQAFLSACQTAIRQWRQIIKPLTAMTLLFGIISLTLYGCVTVSPEILSIYFNKFCIFIINTLMLMIITPLLLLPFLNLYFTWAAPYSKMCLRLNEASC